MLHRTNWNTRLPEPVKGNSLCDTILIIKYKSMKNYEEVVGIDVSKKTIDVSCHLAQQHHVFTNDVKGYQSMINWVFKQTKGVSVFYCFENTGNYSLKLASYLSLKGIAYVEVDLQQKVGHFF